MEIYFNIQAELEDRSAAEQAVQSVTIALQELLPWVFDNVVVSSQVGWPEDVDDEEL